MSQQMSQGRMFSKSAEKRKKKTNPQKNPQAPERMPCICFQPQLSVVRSDHSWSPSPRACSSMLQLIFTLQGPRFPAPLAVVLTSGHQNHFGSDPSFLWISPNIREFLDLFFILRLHGLKTKSSCVKRPQRQQPNCHERSCIFWLVPPLLTDLQQTQVIKQGH